MMEASQVKTVEAKTAAREQKTADRAKESRSGLFQAYLSSADSSIKLNEQPSSGLGAGTDSRSQKTAAAEKTQNQPKDKTDKEQDRAQTSSAETLKNNLLYLQLGSAWLPTGLADQLQLAKALAANSPIILDWSALVDQIVSKVKYNQGRDLANLEITLKPDWIGKLTLDLKWQDGLVQINLIGEAKVKEILEANLDALKNALASAGINLGQLETSLGGQDRSDKQTADEPAEDGLSALAALDPYDPFEPDSAGNTASEAAFALIDPAKILNSGVSCNLIRMVV